MKRLFLVMSLFFTASPLLFSQTGNNFLKNVNVKSDIMYEDAHGVYISYNYDFTDLKNTLKSDSLVNKSNFTFQVLFKTTTGSVKAVPGFTLFKSNKNNLIYSRKLGGNLANFPKDDGFVFIPYAAFDVTEGEHNITADISLSGKDGTGKSYMQQLPAENFTIHKKKQQEITFNIDYVEVDKVDAKGNVWDFSPFGYNTDPDVGVSLMLGGNSVWKKEVENNTVFAMGPKTKNISFMMSQGDEVHIKVTDEDLMFDDFIGEILVKPSMSDTGILHTVNKGSGKIIGCNLNWKIE